MILEENWQIQKNIRKKETTKNEEILSTSTTASTSAFIIYHQPKNEKHKQIWEKIKSLQLQEKC
jgi:hypothetical protein